MNRREYQRLPGSGRRTGFLAFSLSTPRSMLWLGPDHLLSVEAQGFREQYKRFYFRDIQAVITRRTRRTKVQNGWILALCAVLGLLALVTGTAGLAVEGSLLGFCLLLLAVNLLRGPSCACHLRTAVQVEELASLNRLRTAARVLARLRPLIEQAQGALSTEDLAQAGSVAWQAAPAAVNPLARPPQAVRHERGRVHLALFLVLLADGAWTAVDYFIRHVAVSLLGAGVGLAVGVLAVLALVRQHDSDLPAAVRRVAGVVLGYFILSTFIGYVEFVVMAMKHPETTSNQWELLKALAAMSPRESVAQTAVYGFSMLCSFTLGGLGLMRLQEFRRDRERAVAATGRD